MPYRLHRPALALTKLVGAGRERHHNAERLPPAPLYPAGRASQVMLLAQPRRGISFPGAALPIAGRPPAPARQAPSEKGIYQVSGFAKFGLAGMYPAGAVRRPGRPPPPWGGCGPPDGLRRQPTTPAPYRQDQIFLCLLLLSQKIFFPSTFSFSSSSF